MGDCSTHDWADVETEETPEVEVVVETRGGAAWRALGRWSGILFQTPK